MFGIDLKEIYILQNAPSQNTDKFPIKNIFHSSSVHIYQYTYTNITQFSNFNSQAVFSRVARVCKWDKGGPHRFRNRWTSFLKSRLNCSMPGDFPFYFNEIRKYIFYLYIDCKHSNRFKFTSLAQMLYIHSLFYISCLIKLYNELNISLPLYCHIQHYVYGFAVGWLMHLLFCVQCRLYINCPNVQL